MPVENQLIALLSGTVSVLVGLAVYAIKFFITRNDKAKDDHIASLKSENTHLKEVILRHMGHSTSYDAALDRIANILKHVVEEE